MKKQKFVIMLDIDEEFLQVKHTLPDFEINEIREMIINFMKMNGFKHNQGLVFTSADCDINVVTCVTTIQSMIRCKWCSPTFFKNARLLRVEEDCDLMVAIS